MTERHKKLFVRCRRPYIVNKLSHVAMTQEQRKYIKDLVTYSKVGNCLVAKT